NDVRVLSEVYKHCGVIARELGRTEEAEEYLRVAYESALRREDLLLAAESAREQAELYTTLRRNRDALQSLNASHRLFAKLRVQRDIADVRRRIDRLERRFLDVVRQWSQSIESKDRYTLGHCERVADYTCAMAKAMGFDDQTLFWMRICMMLSRLTGRTALRTRLTMHSRQCAQIVAGYSTLMFSIVSRASWSRSPRQSRFHRQRRPNNRATGRIPSPLPSPHDRLRVFRT